MTWYVCYDLDQLPNCCGVLEAGAFVETTDQLRDASYGETLKEAWEMGLAFMRNASGPRPIIFNFAKRNSQRSFDANELRKLIQNQPDALFVHRWRNPSSYNLIEQYVLTNGSNTK